MLHDSAVGEYVDHPKHYNLHPSNLEAIELVRHLDFNIGSAVKYVWRMWQKFDPKEDVNKALWYLRDELADHHAMQRLANPVAVSKAQQFAAAEPNEAVGAMVLAATWANVAERPMDKERFLREAIACCEKLAAAFEPGAVPAAG